MILIGSRALALRNPEILNRKPSDFDFMCSEDEFESWYSENKNKISPTKEPYRSPSGNKIIVEGKTNCEFELFQGSNLLFKELVESDPDTIKTSKFGLVPNLDLLFTLKSSHKYLKNSPHFWKNLSDYHKMKLISAKVRPEYKEFLSLREKETYNYKHPNLNQSKKDFFSDDNIQYVYDHDSIHMAVKHLEKPAYQYFQKDNEEVKSDKKKFFSCSKEIQLFSVVEESAVLAIERSLVPHPGVLTIDRAWKLAFSKVATSISSGWWREFAYENAIDILKLYPQDYFNKFNEALNNNIIKPFK